MSSFKVDTDKIKMFLEGKTFQQCLDEDRLFYCDFQDLEEYIAKSSKEV